MPDQDVVDEDLGEAGRDDIGHDQCNADQDEEHDCRLRVAQFAQQEARPFRSAANLPESLGAFESEYDAGKGPIEFVETDPAATDGGIIEISVLAVDALQHHEMIEVP